MLIGVSRANLSDTVLFALLCLSWGGLVRGCDVGVGRPALLRLGNDLEVGSDAERGGYTGD